MDTLFLQVGGEYLKSFADGVAGSTKSIDVMVGKIVYLQPTDKTAHEKRWSPSVYGEADTQAFALFERDFDIFVCDHHGHDAVARGSLYLFHSPQGVACGREI